MPAPTQPRPPRPPARPVRSTDAPLMTGLLWFDPDNTNNPLQLRHEAQQGDRLAKYGWRKHDGRRYGWQELVDRDYAMNVTMVGAMTHAKGR